MSPIFYFLFLLGMNFHEDEESPQFMVKMETIHKLTKQGYQSKSAAEKSGPE